MTLHGQPHGAAAAETYLRVRASSSLDAQQTGLEPVTDAPIVHVYLDTTYPSDQARSLRILDLLESARVYFSIIPCSGLFEPELHLDHQVYTGFKMIRQALDNLQVASR